MSQSCNDFLRETRLQFGSATVTYAGKGENHLTGEPWHPIPEYDFLGSLSPFWRRVYRLDDSIATAPQ